MAEKSQRLRSVSSSLLKPIEIRYGGLAKAYEKPERSMLYEWALTNCPAMANIF